MMTLHFPASRPRQAFGWLVLGAALSGMTGCSSLHDWLPSRFHTDPPDAVAKLEATKGHRTEGELEFRQRGDGVKVTVRLKGLPPSSIHGFHVHEKGDCSSGDGMSTGGHFNPRGHQHGPQEAEHHAGDMPSLVSDASGQVETTFHLRGVSLSEGAANLVGHGVIVHQGPDDFKTQPTGNSGARISCGVIEAVKKTKP